MSINTTLFSGAHVYCYMQKSTRPFLTNTTCDGHDSHKVSITDRFGAGIPDSVDTGYGPGGYNVWTFYFIKGNLLYKSVPDGDDYHGQLESGYPKPMHDVFPRLPCGNVAITDHANVGNQYVFKGTTHYEIKNSAQLFLHGTMCGNSTG